MREGECACIADAPPARISLQGVGFPSGFVRGASVLPVWAGRGGGAMLPVARAHFPVPSFAFLLFASGPVNGDPVCSRGVRPVLGRVEGACRAMAQGEKQTRRGWDGRAGAGANAPGYSCGKGAGAQRHARVRRLSQARSLPYLQGGELTGRVEYPVMSASWCGDLGRWGASASL